MRLGGARIFLPATAKTGSEMAGALYRRARSVAGRPMGRAFDRSRRRRGARRVRAPERGRYDVAGVTGTWPGREGHVASGGIFSSSVRAPRAKIDGRTGVVTGVRRRDVTVVM